MKTINVSIEEFTNAKDGDILVYENGQWTPTTFAELNKTNETRLNELEKLRYEFKMLADSNKHFTIYAKSHFMVVYNLFVNNVLRGEIDCTDDSIFNLDDEVLNGTISVEEAIEKHPYLKETFDKLYLDEKEIKTFPQV